MDTENIAQDPETSQTDVGEKKSTEGFEYETQRIYHRSSGVLQSILRICMESRDGEKYEDSVRELFVAS